MMDYLSFLVIVLYFIVIIIINATSMKVDICDDISNDFDDIRDILLIMLLILLMIVCCYSTDSFVHDGDDYFFVS